ncbi:D-alanyl-D-alanine carboxypeptidase family protein [Chelativorans sp. M5D2P16]|uniref:D-alanyl-D-alanine carboxypeptidase family protein n=1 Tax=Chelativorans sp. M5D2P16 TaxID=3095678 RepID=UPI002ACAEBAA|nr:D-alanyl-D-alanine carboxypeptidase family protein [Chelativorans sp. M5D2P16]MDZ5699087.1 D-alanyl-D-alanine carboxypeptidase family protein [Chelativorans sp. M5D2P16]
MRSWHSGKLFIAAAFMLALSSMHALAGPYLLFDVGSGRVLAEEDAFKRWYPASLTKLMTAYVAFQAVRNGEMQMNSPVRISQNAAKEPPSKMGYKPGSALTLDNALKIIMVKSANDIATAIAESVGGSEQAFVARMNAYAERLGMTGTHYVNAHGLHSTGQYSTARDLALLVRAIRTEFPAYAGYFSIEGVRDGEREFTNYNYLIGRFQGADGMKTGYVCASGFNLIATATRGRRTLAAIVLGTRSQVERAERAADLLAQGFEKRSFAAQTLASLRPSSPDRHVATDMRPEICSAEAVAKRREHRDEQGRLVFGSPLIRPMTREPQIVAVGLGGADGPESTAPRYADVPIPTPRPPYPARQAVASEGD